MRRSFVTIFNKNDRIYQVSFDKLHEVLFRRWKQIINYTHYLYIEKGHMSIRRFHIVKCYKNILLIDFIMHNIGDRMDFVLKI